MAATDAETRESESEQTDDRDDYPRLSVAAMRDVLPRRPDGGVRLLTRTCARCRKITAVRPDTLCPSCAAALGRPPIPRGPDDE